MFIKYHILFAVCSFSLTLANIRINDGKENLQTYSFPLFLASPMAYTVDLSNGCVCVFTVRAHLLSSFPFLPHILIVALISPDPNYGLEPYWFAFGLVPLFMVLISSRGRRKKRAKPFAKGGAKCLTSIIDVCIIYLTMYKYVTVGIKVDHDILAAYFV